jgi:dipeptidyl aminopeptidase/acylaminoacyl peptidase
MFRDRDAQDPFAREINFGFRCAKYSDPIPDILLAPVERSPRDYTKERPADDATYRILRGLYAYDRSPLNATVEHLPDDSPHWRREKISFDAAYGNERVHAFLFLPRHGPPPYQTVVYFPPGNAFVIRSSAHLDTRPLQFLLQSGRAVLFPIYQGTYDRWVERRGPQASRDLAIQIGKDFGRSVDYLQTRDDIDQGRLAYFGISSGADVAPALLAGEQRLRAAVLLGGGLPQSALPPEIDPINFLPRVTIPVLMLNGRLDFEYPVETSQRPMFDLLGAPPGQKRRVVYESGHAIVAIQPMMKEILDWLDQHLGPVR